MATDKPKEVFDLLLVVDATSSMSNYLDSLRISFPRIISISKLTNSFARIGLLAYRDYSEAQDTNYPILEWSGWLTIGNDQDTESITADQLMNKARSLVASGGADYPEATKTALAKAYSVMREDATTIMLLYTDAPPHCWTAAETGYGNHYAIEQEALKKEDSHGGFGPQFTDWVEGCALLRNGLRKAHVFCFLDIFMNENLPMSSFYLYLSTITRGACMFMTDTAPHSISQVTIDILLAWMGVEKPGVDVTDLPASFVRYAQGADIKKIKDERDPVASSFFWSHDPTINARRDDRRVSGYEWQLKASVQLRTNQRTKNIDSEVLKKFLPKRKEKVGNFAERYVQDVQYKEIVIQELREIIEMDVVSISTNPVFGQLWRVVCNDRGHPARNDLIAAFGAAVERIGDADEKIAMKKWLEESYDYEAEITETLEAVPEDERFPCVFLDPTVEFRYRNGEAGDDETGDNRPITEFKRDELLDIGRSCDGRILRRLGKVLVRLTYAESADALPTHVATSTMKEVPRIPVSLASQAHGFQFWKLLLHTVLPGTMLSTRPAVVLAALAMRIGIKPLFEQASALLIYWRDKWNDTTVPENWNVGCLGLLLDADEEYRKRRGEEQETTDENDGLLLSSDRKLFSQLVAYKLIEANLCTTLTADVSWTPAKTQLPVGHVVICSRCKHPRSVTIMAEKSGGQCGLCVAQDWKDAAHKKRALEANVTKEGNLAWVECSAPACRAQYVCYNTNDLNVRAKCHYCRHGQGVAPALECEKCLSRVIWPKEWRTASGPFHCVACSDGRKTIVSVETSAGQLSKENGQGWLLRNDNDSIKQPFQGTLFRTITTTGTEAFLANVEILPENANPLTLHGRPVQNQAALKATLESWIHRRSAEKTPCSLCFTDLPNTRLLPACRRRGCDQRICESCLNNWYGQNKVGNIINPAALFCPFCRRPPAARTLAAYGKGIHAVGDLMIALSEQGQWIHAWCRTCGRARRHLERDCARGAPEQVEDFACEECRLEAFERAHAAEEEARREADAVMRITMDLDETERRVRVAEAHRQVALAERARLELDYPVKKCPGCGVRSQKSNGCDHLMCPIKTCGVHWCWNCVKIFSQHEIYDHMSEDHGGWDDRGAWGNRYYRFGGVEDFLDDGYDYDG